MGVRIRQNGFVFDPKSHESLALALRTLSTAPALREVMGKASRVIIGNFSCNVFARNALLAARAAMGEKVSSPRALSPAEQAVGVPSGLAP
jgi:glycosyltransferase involved in cell wall biosynthesis